jgi:hypothetical protein
MANAPRDEGGHAFPVPVAVSTAGDVYPAFSGMSQRDWFAGQALAGLAAHTGSTPRELVAQTAYELADAMLAERAKGGAQ